MAAKPVRGMSRRPPGYELRCKLPVAPPRLVQVIAYTRWPCMYNNLRSRRNSPNDQGPITVSARDLARGGADLVHPAEGAFVRGILVSCAAAGLVAGAVCSATAVLQEGSGTLSSQKGHGRGTHRPLSRLEGRLR